MNIRFWTAQFWKETGYGLGSSRFLVRKLISIADIQDAGIILELWAGYWPVTEHILATKSKNTEFIVIENDREKFLELSRKYGHLCKVYEMSAAHIDTIIDPETIDIVISTLPLGSISHPWVGHILSAAHLALRKWGKFLQYQYALQNLRDVKKYFVLDRISFELRNIWPAFIYLAHKK